MRKKCGHGNSDTTDVRNDGVISQEMVEFIEHHCAKSVSMVDGIIGCPHQEGIDYDGDWWPVCNFWKDRDRFTGKRLS
jgi:hypothetical protein